MRPDLDCSRKHKTEQMNSYFLTCSEISHSWVSSMSGNTIQNYNSIGKNLDDNLHSLCCCSISSNQYRLSIIAFSL